MMARDSKYHAPAFGGLNVGGLDKLFGDLFGSLTTPPKGASALAGRSAAPAVDVYEEAAQYVVEASVPGLTREQLTVEFEDGVLTLGGEWSSERDEQSEQALRRERARGSFTRELRFSDRVDAERLGASLADGVLTITLPKAAQALRKQIDIA